MADKWAVSMAGLWKQSSKVLNVRPSTFPKNLIEVMQFVTISLRNVWVFEGSRQMVDDALKSI